MAKEGALRAAGQNRKEMRDVSTRARPTAALESVFRGIYPPRAHHEGRRLRSRTSCTDQVPEIQSKRFVYSLYCLQGFVCCCYQLRQSQIPLKIYCLSEFVCCVPIPLGRITTRRRFISGSSFCWLLATPENNACA